MAAGPLACGSDHTAAPTADLPQGWESARLIEDFSQTQCEGSPYEGTPDAMVASAGEGSIHVTYTPAHFRCGQPLNGFVRSAPARVDVLVQPVDMNPPSVAKCDCLYTIELNVAAESGDRAVALYRRWDHRSGAAMLKVGEAEVSIR